jgi:predicted esterase
MKLLGLRWFGFAALGTLICALAGGGFAQDYTPSPSQAPDAATRKKIDDKMAKLADMLNALRQKNSEDSKFVDAFLADIDVFHQAAARIVRLNEFFQKDSAAWTLEALDRGLERVSQLGDFFKSVQAGTANKDTLTWLDSTKNVTTVRGYRSLIDGSVQPYAVTLPEDYEAQPKKWRVDMVLHGRDKDLNEVKFLHQFHNKPAPQGLDYVRIDIFGRGNNAYRWAGEVDIYEVRLNFDMFEQLLGRGKLLDPQRNVLRGFSMGGAGTWHIGLHRPDRWCVIGPGAGFTATHGYVKGMPAVLGWPLEQLLRIYDAVDYADNATNVPIVAYAGSKDPQLQAARNIEEALKSSKLPLQFEILVAPGLEHTFPPEWQKKAEAAYAPFVKKGRPEFPKRVHFVTYTLRYAACDWVDIVGLEKHYEKATVDAEKTEDGFKVTTTNIDILRLRVPKDDLHEMTVDIDRQQVNVRPWDSKGGEYHVWLEKRGGKWSGTMPQKISVEQSRSPRKVSGLQGPIDDAFISPFLCVRASGQPWSDRVDDYAEASLKRFQAEWAKYMRGQVPVKNDVDVTSEDILSKNLILFGDPGGNSMLANVLYGLPLTWTKDKLTMDGKSYPSANSVPLLVYPNPLHPQRYVVLNSGHTFHAADFQGTNALLYPRIGDYAVVRIPEKGPVLQGEQVELNGLFNEYWRFMDAK